MSIGKRILYYLAGVGIGVILLMYFVGGSGASCDYAYGPNARVLKNIRLKNKTYSPQVLQGLKDRKLDTADLAVLYQEGDVLFGESDTKLDSCKLYAIKGLIKEQELKFKVENCDSLARFIHLE